MKKQFLKFIVLLTVFALIVSPLHIDAKENEYRQNQCLSKPSVELTSALRKLWIDHMILGMR